MKLKSIWKFVRKPRKQIQKCRRRVTEFLRLTFRNEIDEENENGQLGLGIIPEEFPQIEIAPIGGDESSKFAVISSEIDLPEVNAPPMDAEDLPLAMASNLDAIFRRYFHRRADKFALTNVESMHEARKRQRQFQYIKELLLEMIEHWEEQQYRQSMRQFGKDGFKEIGLDRHRVFMDAYFGTLWDFLMECSQTLESAFPRELAATSNRAINAKSAGGNKNGKRSRHQIYGPLTSTMISDEKEEENGQKISDFKLDFDDIVQGQMLETVSANGIQKKNFWPNQIDGNQKSGYKKGKQGERPKSAAIYLF